MKTTIDIPDSELQEAMRHSRARTKREAVLSALREYNRRNRMAELTSVLGTFEKFMTQEDLEKLRENR